ncbi:hypothetical protein niasHT_002168 [Heterodera trifolii]|uniref:Telomere length regulation protein conserved domain-containing protein n=1 Tax=Heterodera trifolii TaxID=157864 RepID=A0ABD2M0Y4_9BILA
MIVQNGLLHNEQHLTSAAHCQFDFFLDRIKSANNRTELLALFYKLPEFFCVADTTLVYLLTQTFLQKLAPPVFGYITEADFDALFSDALFLRSPWPATSLWALICSLSQCDGGGAFQFSKCVELLTKVQRELLRKALTNAQNSEDGFQFAFVLSSFTSRVYNFFGGNESFHRRNLSQFCEFSSPSLSSDAFDRAATIVATFEDNLLAVLVEVAEKEPSVLNMALYTHILTEYSTASAGGEEFIRRFFAAALSNPKTLSFLHQIFAQKRDECFHRAESRRNWEAMLRIVVTMAPNGQCLQRLFGDSLLSDAHFRPFLIERVSLVPSSSANCRPRNSEKIADFLALSAPAISLTAFLSHVQLFVDRSKVVEMASLHSHFVQSLAVVDFARRLNSEQRCSVRDQLMFSLVPIVPQMVEIADCSRRQIGMLMCEVLFSLFEFPSPPQFDYAETDPMLREFREALQHQQNQNSTELNGEDVLQEKPFERQPKRSPIDARVTILLDSDDDEETEKGQNAENGCDYDEEAASPSDRPAYLRDCLEILLQSNPNDQSVKMCHWVGAFRVIPEMLRKRSIGWNTLGEGLMEMILQLNDRYNLPDFEEIRMEILKLLLAQSPELVSNAFRTISSRCCPMSRRFLLLSSVVNAAKFLANGGGEGAKTVENTTKIEQTTNYTNQIGEGKGCKVIRRSATLQKRDGKSHENAFSRVAPQFVFPLLHFYKFDSFCDVAQSNVFLGKLALTLGELVGCAAHSPSILSILSSSFAWLSVLRRFGAPRHPFVRHCSICVYLAICDTFWPSTEVLREHFTDELRDCREWLGEMATEFALGEMDETIRQSIGLLSVKIDNILRL